MTKKHGSKSPKAGPELRLDPEDRLVSKFDSESIAKFPIASEEEMGFRVKDDCAEEHIM